MDDVGRSDEPAHSSGGGSCVDDEEHFASSCECDAVSPLVPCTMTTPEVETGQRMWHAPLSLVLPSELFLAFSFSFQKFWLIRIFSHLKKKENYKTCKLGLWYFIMAKEYVESNKCRYVLR